MLLFTVYNTDLFNNAAVANTKWVNVTQNCVYVEVTAKGSPAELPTNIQGLLSSTCAQLRKKLYEHHRYCAE
jgi:hypothetical protein